MTIDLERIFQGAPDDAPGTRDTPLTALPKIDRNFREIASAFSRRGTSAQRPTGLQPQGLSFFDTSLGQPIFYKGLGWVDAMGAAVGPMVGAAVDLDFAHSSYWIDAQRRSALGATSFTRASTGVAQRLDGSWVEFAPGVPRITDRGILLEEARTNSLRNSTMAGAAAGTPGTLPTNWSIFSTPAGITRSVVGTGVEDGIAYIDFRFAGTAGATGSPAIYFDALTQVSASSGQTWTATAFMRLVAGASPDWNIQVGGFNSVPSFTESTAGTVLPLTSQWARRSVTRTLNNGGTVAVVGWVSCTIANGSTVDFTVRVGWPQLEQGSFATSPIPTSGSAGTRAADLCTIPGLTGYASGMSLYARASFNFPSGTDAPDRIAVQIDADSNNRTFLSKVASTGKKGATTIGGAATQAAFASAEDVLLDVPVSFATTVFPNDARAAFDGTLATPDTAVTLPTSPTTLRIGAAGYFGYIERVTLWPTVLTNEQLQVVTAP